MADSKPKFDPKLIKGQGRLAFFRPTPEARLGRDNKPKGDPKASCTVLLDPSNKLQAATIQEIKEESVRALNHRYGEGKFNVKVLEEVAAGTKSFPNFHLCWGLGDDLPALGKKLYDGFANMFYLKLSDKNRPNLLNRKGVPVIEGEPQYPYSGCAVAFTTTMYSYDNESRGVNGNFRTLVFMDEGQAFGGGKPDAASEYQALGLSSVDDNRATGSPFDGSAAGDPFAIT